MISRPQGPRLGTRRHRNSFKARRSQKPSFDPSRHGSSIPSQSGKLFKSDIATVITDFKTTSTPLIQLEAAIFNKAYSEYLDKSYIDLSANIDHPLTYNDVPLDHLSFKLLDAQVTHLREVKLGSPTAMLPP